MLTFGQLKQPRCPTSRDTQTGGVDDAYFPWRRVLHYGFEMQKYNSIHLDNENLNVSTKTVGCHAEQYFTTASVRGITGRMTYTANLGNGVVAIGYKSQPVLVSQPDRQTASTLVARLFRTKWLPLRRIWI